MATETKLREMMIGQNVTVPTIAWGTWTGELISIRFPLGQYAPEGDVFFTIRHESGTEEEVRTNLNYSGYINRDIQIKTDEQVAEAMGTTIDDQRPEGPLCAACGDETCNTSDAHHTVTEFGAEMVIIDVKVPDYADIMRLENMVWNATALRTDYQEYAKYFHKLATEYTEDVLLLCIEQYNTGRKW